MNRVRGSAGVCAAIGVFGSVIVVPGIAHADGLVIIGSDCNHSQLNVVADATDGTTARCIAVGEPQGFAWAPDPGHPVQDAQLVGRAGSPQAAFDDCMLGAGNTAAECQWVVYGRPLPDAR